jgi:type VI secretion system protein ImpG
MFNRYYQDELNYLRALGAEYSKLYPENAKYLAPGADDPDVERLLQGFAFLSARLHQRLDDQFSQVAEGFLSSLWPQVLRPIPSFATVKFDADQQVLRNTVVMPRGVELHSISRGAGYHRFQTCREVILYPFHLAKVNLTSAGDRTLLCFSFELNPGSALVEDELQHLDFHITGGDPTFTYGWYKWLVQHSTDVRLVSDSGQQSGPLQIMPLGFGDEVALYPETLLPGEKETGDLVRNEEIAGHRLLREFFAFPEHFLYFRLVNLKPLAHLSCTSRFQLQIDIGTQLPTGSMRDELATDSFRLFCVPACNVFESVSRILADHTRTEYIVRSDELDVEQHEVFDIQRVVGVEQGTTSRSWEYVPFFAKQLAGPEARPWYRVRFEDIHMRQRDRIGENVPLPGQECFMSLYNPKFNAESDGPVAVTATIRCCSRGGASSLRLGELTVPTATVPAFVRFTNITTPTLHRSGPKDQTTMWLLVAMFTSARQSMAQVGNLKSLLRVYGGSHSSTDAGASNRWIDALTDVAVKPGIVLEGGTVLRILDVSLHFDCDPARVPQFFLFGAVLSEFLRKIATINSRLRFRLRFGDGDTVGYPSPMRSGTCGNL